MFTGLIEECGVILCVSRDETGEYARIRIGAPRIARGLAIGDSVAINGVCLTVIRRSPYAARAFSRITGNQRHAWFEAEMLAATLEKTSLRTITPGVRVNLERALRANSRMGGHFVAGHVSCIGTIQSFEHKDKNYFLTVCIPPKYMPYMMREGSVALDGISLTIATVNEHAIMCNIIPHTREVTTLHAATPGDSVNVEPDLLARYVERMTQAALQ